MNGGSFNSDDPDRPRWSSQTKVVKDFVYEDEVGSEKFTVHKGINPSGEKCFRMSRQNTIPFDERFEPEEKPGRLFNVPPEHRIPYNLPAVIKAVAARETVYFVEGEKDADTLNRLGLTATTVPCGAGKWQDNYAPYFVGADIVILPDKDKKGEAHGELLLNRLQLVAASVKILNLPGLGSTEDVTDWVDAGHTLDELLDLADKARTAQPKGWTSAERAEIERLAALSAGEYDKERKTVAKALGWRVATLDDAVALLRPKLDAPPGSGSELRLEDPKPWEGSVDGQELVQELQAVTKRHVVLTDEQALGVALWIVHSHALEKAEHSPRLHISSPVKRCGKTVLLNSVAALVPRGLATENISPAALFRLTEMHAPTLLIDEADTFLNDNEDMRGLLNAGHSRSGKVIRVVGDNHEPRAFSVWGAVVLAGIGEIPATIEDRSITIPLRRRRPDEIVERLRRNRSHLDALARKAARWVADNINRLGEDPALPEELHDRAQDNWRPLIAIADAIAPALGEAARRAACTLELDKEADDGAGAELLVDVYAIFIAAGQDRLSSKYIVDELIKQADRPWATWRRGQPLTTNSLGRLLKPFEIRPKQIKSANGKGLDREPIVKAYERYCSPKEDLIDVIDPM